jgi:hypothetical protein
MKQRVSKEELLEKGAVARRESKNVEFKESCDFEALESACEVIKDIVAMANSGGGMLIFGVRNDGSECGFDGPGLLAYDSAKITDKILKYTNRQFGDFEMLEISRNNKTLTAMIVSGVSLPMVFTKAGTYRNESGKEKVAFQQGTFYFRHGAKSEPGNSDDLAEVIQREVERLRKNWLSNIKKVTQAPAGSVVRVMSPTDTVQSTITLPARIVADATAPGVRPEAADDIWPHRTKKIIALVNSRLNGATKINSYDIQCIRRVFDIEKIHPEFCYRPFARSPAQYSDAFVTWLVEEYQKDDQFFSRTRISASN